MWLAAAMCAAAVLVAVVPSLVHSPETNPTGKGTASRTQKSAKAAKAPPKTQDVLAKQSEAHEHKSWVVPCAKPTRGAKTFEGCTPRGKCGRFVTDLAFPEAQVSTLVKMASKWMALGGGKGGATILDLHSGALSLGEQFIDVYALPGPPCARRLSGRCSRVRTGRTLLPRATAPRAHHGTRTRVPDGCSREQGLARATLPAGVGTPRRSGKGSRCTTSKTLPFTAASKTRSRRRLSASSTCPLPRFS